MIYPLNHSAIQSLRAVLPPRARVYVGGCSGEPVGFATALARLPELAAGLTFLGVWIPGVNRTEWAGLHADARAETIFLSAELQSSFAAARTTFLPLSYTQAWRWLGETPLDLAVVMVPEPRADGTVGLGVSADFGPVVLARSEVRAVALVNPLMPDVRDGPRSPLSRFSRVFRDPAPLTGARGSVLPPAFTQLAAHVVGLINDGDTLQFGLGNVQQAVLEQLAGHRDLRLHAGMISDPLLPLLDAGAVSEVTTGVAIGSPDLYARAAMDPRITFRPVGYTHAPQTLAALPHLKAVNSVLEVDLFGQANAEYLDGRLISGTGGLVDFLRGAAGSPGGRGILCLTSTARGGSVSRIVPCLAAPTVSVARADVDTVVTEHGVAQLRGLDLEGRAQALIGVADPAHREGLTRAWRGLQAAL